MAFCPSRLHGETCSHVVWIPCQPLHSYVTLSKLLNLSVLQFLTCKIELLVPTSKGWAGKVKGSILSAWNPVGSGSLLLPSLRHVGNGKHTRAPAPLCFLFSLFLGGLVQALPQLVFLWARACSLPLEL